MLSAGFVLFLFLFFFWFVLVFLNWLEILLHKYLISPQPQAQTETRASLCT